MRQNHSFPVVTTISVTITIIFYTVFTKFISPLITGFPGLGFIVGLFASVGFYVTVFQALQWIYFKLIHDKVNPKENILGEWFYKLEILGKEGHPRYGLCHIIRHDGNNCLTGIHYHPELNKFTSRFTSDFVWLNGDNLIILYTSVGVDEETFLRRGVFFLSTEGSPPKRVYGVWSDLLPSRNAGDIVMQRRDKNTDAILEDIGYPRGSSELQKILNLIPSAASTNRLVKSKEIEQK